MHGIVVRAIDASHSICASNLCYNASITSTSLYNCTEYMSAQSVIRGC